MTAPKHLWSGDWRRDSEAAARELAERRTPPEQPTPTPEETAPPEPRASTRHPRRPRRPSRASLIALAALLSTVAAFAIVWVAVGSGGSGPAAGAQSPAQASTRAAWLGVDTTDFTAASGGGALVTKVVPGGPADAAGLQPGDLIIQIGNTPIASPGVIAFALADLHPGDSVQIQFQRGPLTRIVQLTLGAQPAGHP